MFGLSARHRVTAAWVGLAWGSGLLLVLGLPACAPPPTVQPRPSTTPAQTAVLPATALPPGPRLFTIRGRLEQPRNLTWSWTGAEGPLPTNDCRRAVEQALDAWRASAVLDWRPAPAGQAGDVVFGWRAGQHEDDQPFGKDPSLAHTGAEAGSHFVHFDAQRDWKAQHSLTRVAMHEIGHVLGLGHSPDPQALMFPDSVVSAPGAGDLAGVHSLYGGGLEAPSDLTIVTLGGLLPTCQLRGVAPPGETDWCVFDTDGDGADEVLVWSTQPEGHGALTQYHFESGAAGPQLVRTWGPLLGVTSVGATVRLRHSPAPLTAGPGAQPWRWLLIEPAADAEDAGQLRVYALDAQGRLVAPNPLERRALEFDDPWPVKASHARRVELAKLPAGVECMAGDLDGDGRLDYVLRKR